MYRRLWSFLTAEVLVNKQMLNKSYVSFICMPEGFLCEMNP